MIMLCSNVFLTTAKVLDAALSFQISLPALRFKWFHFTLLYRSKAGEAAFLAVYEKLYEAPDPAPGLLWALVTPLVSVPVASFSVCVCVGVSVHACLRACVRVCVCDWMCVTWVCACVWGLQDTAARTAEVEAQAMKLAGELAEFKAESQGLMNQQLTVRKLEERVRNLEGELAAKVGKGW